MAFTTVPSAGARLYASTLSSLITELRPLSVLKTADETVNNSTTMQNDDQLLISVEANITYDFFLRLIVNTNATADFKMQFTGPAGATMSTQAYTGSNPDTAASALQGPTNNLTTVAAFSGVAADQVLIIQGFLAVSATAGTLQLQWAQNTLNVSNTSVKANSYMWLQRKF